MGKILLVLVGLLVLFIIYLRDKKVYKGVQDAKAIVKKDVNAVKDAIKDFKSKV